MKDIITALDKNGRAIVLIVDSELRLVDTITDGDVRRALLAGLSMDVPASTLQSRKQNSMYSKPIVATVGIESSELLKLMYKWSVRHIPLVNEEEQIVDLVMMEDILPDEKELAVQTLIMAGGSISRLHPLVEDIPKPMLPVGNKPLLELTLSRLRQAGISNVNLTTRYKSESIEAYFGNGTQFGVQLNYIDEKTPLGTAGALAMLEGVREPILVINGDVLTKVDFNALIQFHKQHEAEMTVAVRRQEFSVPYGIVSIDGEMVSSVDEKPKLSRFINAGIYLLNPDLLNYIPASQAYNMTDLINQLISKGRRVVSFPIHEYWSDVDGYEDYQQILTDADNGVLNDLISVETQFEPGAPAPSGFIPLCVPEIRGNEWAYIKECLDTNWVSSVGSFVTRFEKTIADYVGVEHAVATGSGTAALHLSLLVAGVEPNDEVFVSSETFIAPANAIRYTGAWPLFCDIEAAHWQLDPQKLADFIEANCTFANGKLINKQTGRKISAIVPVHILGHPCDMEPIVIIARRYNLRIIEDATESLGAQYQGQMIGSLGDIACFSFNGNKLITTGGGGMIVTNDAQMATKAKYLSTQAKDNPLEYIHNEIGYNYRLTNIQAAMGCAQLEQLEAYIETKRRIADRYNKAFAKVPGLKPMQEADWAVSVDWMYTILIDEAVYPIGSRGLLNALAKRSIQSRPLWQPMHMSVAHKASPSMECAVAEQIHRQALSLPCSVGLSSEEQTVVINTVLEILGSDG